MDEINKLYSLLDSIDDFTEKNKIICQINSLIPTEKDKLNQQLITLETKDIGSNKFKIPVKYKKYSIDDLEKLLYETHDIDEKISIYYTIKVMVENIKNKLFNLV